MTARMERVRAVEGAGLDVDERVGRCVVVGMPVDTGDSGRGCRAE